MTVIDVSAAMDEFAKVGAATTNDEVFDEFLDRLLQAISGIALQERPDLSEIAKSYVPAYRAGLNDYKKFAAEVMDSYPPEVRALTDLIPEIKALNGSIREVIQFLSFHDPNALYNLMSLSSTIAPIGHMVANAEKARGVIKPLYWPVLINAIGAHLAKEMPFAYRSGFIEDQRSNVRRYVETATKLWDVITARIPQYREPKGVYLRSMLVLEQCAYEKMLSFDL